MKSVGMIGLVAFCDNLVLAITQRVSSLGLAAAVEARER
jgi:hypothetical protein